MMTWQLVCAVNATTLVHLCNIYMHIIIMMATVVTPCINLSHSHSLSLSRSVGEDFNLPPEIIFTTPFFPVGSEDGDLLCFNISIIDDSCFEGDHNFLINLVSPEQNVAFQPVQSASVMIRDNDGVCQIETYAKCLSKLPEVIELQPQHKQSTENPNCPDQ